MRTFGTTKFMRQILVFILFPLLLWAGKTIADNQFDLGTIGILEASPAEKELDITLDENELTVQYGAYTEFQIALTKEFTQSVKWEVVEGEMPAGLFLEDAYTDSILIFGTPKFTDRWCSTVKASIENGPSLYRELCFQSEDNDQLVYPRFDEPSILDPVWTGTSFRRILAFQFPEGGARSEGFGISADRGDLPARISIEEQPDDSRFLLYGSAEKPDVHRFTLELLDGEEILNARQHQLDVLPSDSEYDCPPGYSYNESLGYCVADRAEDCPDGTYYDPEIDSCIQYPTPPPGIICRPGYYYDHYLDRCVRSGYRRCPTGYHWDHHYDRCIRDRHSCPNGYYYDWDLRRCVRHGHHQRCPDGYRYDYRRDRCVRVPMSCRPGYHWDYGRERCVPNRNNCPPGEVFEPGRGCRPDVGRCPPGYRWDPRDRRCERISRPPRECPPGSRWSHEERRCVPFGPPPMGMPPMGMPMPPPSMPMDPPMNPMPPMDPPMGMPMPPMNPPPVMNPPPMPPMDPPMGMPRPPMDPPMGMPKPPMNPPPVMNPPPMPPMDPPMGMPMPPMEPPMGMPKPPMNPPPVMNPPPMPPMSPPMQPPAMPRPPMGMGRD